MNNDEVLNNHLSKKTDFYNQLSSSIVYLRQAFDLPSNNIYPSTLSWTDIAAYFLAVKYIEKDQYQTARQYLEKQQFLRSNELTIERVRNTTIQETSLVILADIFNEPDTNKDDEGVYQFGPYIGSDIDYIKELTAIKHALEIVKIHAPEYFSLISNLIETIYVCGKLEHGYMRSATTTKAFGCLVNTALTKGNTVQYMEDLVHEASHLLLYLEQIDDPIVLNDKTERFTAPFRSDLRPIEGIYHAMFVLGHVSLCFTQILAKEDINLPQDALTKHKESALKRFYESSHIITKYGKLTKKGQRIHHQLQAKVQSLC